MQKVNKRTRAGKLGKNIICPKCSKKSLVYHFSWFSISSEVIGRVSSAIGTVPYKVY